jgi:NitT/TauT family transport system permease protein
MDCLRDRDPVYHQMMKIMGATNRELAIKVLLPGSLPWIFTGLRVAVSYAFTAAVHGKLVSSNHGLGFLKGYSAA